MSRRFWIVNMRFLFAAGTCVALAVGAGLGVAAATYDGSCHGFTDGSAPCTWEDYAGRQIFWALLLALIPAAAIGAAWGGYTAASLARRFDPGRPGLVLATAAIGGAGGLALAAGAVIALQAALGAAAR